MIPTPMSPSRSKPSQRPSKTQAFPKRSQAQQRRVQEEPFPLGWNQRHQSEATAKILAGVLLGNAPDLWRCETHVKSHHPWSLFSHSGARLLQYFVQAPKASNTKDSMRDILTEVSPVTSKNGQRETPTRDSRESW